MKNNHDQLTQNVAIRTAVESYLKRCVAKGERHGNIHQLRIPFWDGDYFFACVHDLQWHYERAGIIGWVFGYRPTEWKCGLIHTNRITSDGYWKLVDLMNYDIENKR